MEVIVICEGCYLLVVGAIAPSDGHNVRTVPDHHLRANCTRLVADHYADPAIFAAGTLCRVYRLSIGLSEPSVSPRRRCERTKHPHIRLHMAVRQDTHCDN